MMVELLCSPLVPGEPSPGGDVDPPPLGIDRAKKHSLVQLNE
jgi:hypothetical protein